MRTKLLLFTAAAILIFALDLSYSQPNYAIRYMPLSIGNKWVYTVFYNTIYCCRQRFTIVSDTVIAGRKYYKSYPGLPIYHIPYNSINLYRVDSLTGNFYGYLQSSTCGISPSEVLIDSLGARVNTISTHCYNLTQRILTDTSLFPSPWGPSYQRKRYQYYNGSTQTPSAYFLNFGLAGTAQGYIGQDAYNILGCYINGVLYGDTNVVTGINQISSEVPNSFSLSQNYPNPFNPKTVLGFQFPVSSFVTLKIYDVLGKEIKTLVNEQLQPGTYEVDFDGTDLPSGVYYYKLTAGDYFETRKMVLIK